MAAVGCEEDSLLRQNVFAAEKKARKGEALSRVVEQGNEILKSSSTPDQRCSRCQPHPKVQVIFTVREKQQGQKDLSGYNRHLSCMVMFWQLL